MDFGLHILRNPNIQSIFELADIRPTDVVLGMGPCIENITERILQNAREVIAYEIDPTKDTPTQAKVSPSNFIRVDPPTFNLCIANAPNEISRYVVNGLIKFLCDRPEFRCAVLMLEKKFAKMLVAQPGDEDYTKLSVTIQFLAEVQIIMQIRESDCKFPPKIDCCVVKIMPSNLKSIINYHEMSALISILFMRKNETLSTVFNRIIILDLITRNCKCHFERNKIPVPENFNAREIINDILSKNNMEEMQAQTMSINDFIRVLSALKERNIHLTLWSY